MNKAILIDFWRENPFKALDLPFPPVPAGNEIARKITEKGKRVRAELDNLNGKPDVKEEIEALEKEKSRLDELREQLLKKADEMREGLPFDTLLTVQSPVHRVFTDIALRNAVGAELWHELAGANVHGCLSDTNREDFAADQRHHSILDEDPGTGRREGNE